MDSDIPSLARLHELSDLDFSGGMVVEEAKITDDGLAELAKLNLRHLETCIWARVSTSPMPEWTTLAACKRLRGSDCRLAHMLPTLDWLT